MRICLLGPIYPYRGGIAHYDTFLVRELRREHAVKVISYKRQFPLWIHPGGKSDKDPSGEVHRIDKAEYLLDALNPLSWRRVARSVRDFDPDLLILPWWTVYWAPHYWIICRSVKRRNRPEILFICHNVVDHESNALKRWLTKGALGLADRFVVHSVMDRGKLLAVFPGANVTTGFLPTYEDLSGGRVPKDEAKRRLGLDGPVLLFFGYVRPYKGLGVAIEALAQVLERVKVTLIVAGQFWKGQEKHLEKARQRGLEKHMRVVARYVRNEEIPLYFGASDLVILPYLSGSGSGAAQLAFGFDRPVVSTNVGSLPEVVEDGVNGRLVKPGDAGGLARAIVESLEPQTLERLSANAAKTKGKFSWEAMTRIIVGKKPD